MKLLKIKYLKEIEVSELDLVNEDKIFGRNDDGHQYEQDIEVDFDETMWAREAGDQIDIDIAIEILQTLKEAGANYVEIMHHSDHHGYVFNGVEMWKATEEEITIFLNEYKKKEEEYKQFEIERLEKQIAILKGE